MVVDGRQRWIEPAEYHPPVETRRWPIAPWLSRAALVGMLIAVVGALWFVLTLRAVSITIEPEPEYVDLSGATLRMAEHFLARSGSYRLEAGLAGYHPLDEEIEVPADGPSEFRFELRPLPGRVDFVGTPDGARISVDGEVLGDAPLADALLEPGGHELLIEKPEFLPDRRELEVEGRDVEQTVEFSLQPSHAPVTLTSSPPGARIVVDGEAMAETPATLPLAHGERELTLIRAGYRRWSRTLTVEGGQAQTLPEIELVPAPATLDIVSVPQGARIRVDGDAVGRAPLRLDLEPGKTVSLRLDLPGYQPLTREVTPAADSRRTLTGELVPIPATLRVQAEPAAARLWVDGREAGPVGVNGLELQLPATTHTLELKLDGYVPLQREVELSADAPTELALRLQTELEARIARLQPLIRAADGQTLALVEPGRFTMGSPRGEQGRQSDELQREVELTRLFYVGLHEVTNEQFRQFRPAHSSGIVGDRTLDNEQQPVVRVDFDAAAEYCNWLSEQDGLAPAYRRTGSGYALIEPVGQGYRLPSEAEWAWVARFAGERSLKYPWGESMPPPAGAGNFADASAARLLAPVIPGYSDGHPASAPVGEFEPNAVGVHDLGGNVSEWTGDRYELRLTEIPELKTDPIDARAGGPRVVRGSSWRHAGISPLRLAWRDSAEQGRDDLGFRIVRYAE